jgi:hypothetical protein
MTRRKKQTSNLDVGFYIVAFIDLLGQQEHLRALVDLPDKQDPSQMEFFRSTLKQTYGVVDGMRKSFEKFFNSFSRRPINQPRMNQLTAEQKKQYRELTSYPIQFQRFSDSMVIFLPLRTDTYKLPTAGIFGILGAAATSFICQLATGHPIRGGIDVGVAMEMTKGEIYGAALSRAYSLESKVAMYPRIVLGKELVDYLQLTHMKEPTDIYSAAGKEMAKSCLDLLAVDDDGHAFLDYLGQGFKKHIAYDLDAKVITMAYEQVLKQSERCQREKNSMLAFRYTLLRNYFEARLPLWLEEATTMPPAIPDGADK